ncbi:MAG TPA: hypothetical protein VFR85_11300 [Anaeromyxobacteraceae bacterium]|nr:hypothetical protein [Anaeromyxobacteraceae bacterium]
MRSSSRALLLRAAAALRRLGAALARAARGGRLPANGGPAPGGGRGASDDSSRAPGARARADAPSPAPPGDGEGAFLSEVKETLLELSAGPEPPPPGLPRGEREGEGRRARLRRLGAFLEPVRRYEDLVLALALLVGIAMMILHWVP